MVAGSDHFVSEKLVVPFQFFLVTGIVEQIVCFVKVVCHVVKRMRLGAVDIAHHDVFEIAAAESTPGRFVEDGALSGFRYELEHHTVTIEAVFLAANERSEVFAFERIGWGETGKTQNGWEEVFGVGRVFDVGGPLRAQPVRIAQHPEQDVSVEEQLHSVVG